MSKELSEMCPLGEKMAKIWLKLQENGEKKSQMAKVMAKEKYILARTLCYLITECIKRQKKLIGSNDDNGIKHSFRRQIFLSLPKFTVRYLYL